MNGNREFTVYESFQDAMIYGNWSVERLVEG